MDGLMSKLPAFLFMDEMKRRRWLWPYLIFLSAVPAMTTDMYLPALPTMAEHFNSTLGEINLTLVPPLQ